MVLETLVKNRPLLLHPPFGLGEKTIKNFRHFSFFSTFSLFFCSKLERVRMKHKTNTRCGVLSSRWRICRSPNSKWETTKPKPKPKKEMGKRERERGNNEERGESPNPPFHLELAPPCRFERHGPIRCRYPARSRLEVTPAFVTKIANKRIRITPRKRKNECEKIFLKKRRE